MAYETGYKYFGEGLLRNLIKQYPHMTEERFNVALNSYGARVRSEVTESAVDLHVDQGLLKPMRYTLHLGVEIAEQYRLPREVMLPLSQDDDFVIYTVRLQGLLPDKDGAYNPIGS